MKKATVLYLLVGTTALTAATLICKQKAYDRGYEAGKNAGYKKAEKTDYRTAWRCVMNTEVQ